MREASRIYEQAGIFSGDEAAKLGCALGIQPLSSGEKELLLTNPEMYKKLQHTHGNLSESMLYNGTRHLCNEQAGLFYLSGEVFYESYNYTIDLFTSMLKAVRSYQHKTPSETLYGEEDIIINMRSCYQLIFQSNLT